MVLFCDSDPPFQFQKKFEFVYIFLGRFCIHSTITPESRNLPPIINRLLFKGSNAASKMILLEYEHEVAQRANFMHRKAK